MGTISSASPDSTPVVQTLNYLVPSSGATHIVPISGTVDTVNGATIDWRQFSNDSFAFQPQGVYIDNTQNTGKLTIAVYAQGGGPAQPGALIWKIVVDAGQVMHTPFPAPNGQVHLLSSTGNGGPVTLVYADFPVLPFLFTP